MSPSSNEPSCCHSPPEAVAVMPLFAVVQAIVLSAVTFLSVAIVTVPSVSVEVFVAPLIVAAIVNESPVYSLPLTV